MKKALLALVFILGLAVTGAAQNAKHAAAVLMDRFETVASTRSSFLLDSESRIHTHYIPSENALRFPFLYWLAALSMLDPDAASSIEKTYGTVMVGAKAFRIPMSAEGELIGMFHSTHTYVAVLDDKQASPDLSQVLGKADYETVLGKRAWTWTMPPYEGHPEPTTFHAQQLGAYFVLSNDKTEFEAAMTSLVARPTSENVKDWDSLSSYAYWLHRDVRAKNQIDLMDDVVSFTMVTNLADGAKDGAFSVQVLSSNLTMQEEPNVLYIRPEGKGLLHPGEKGMWHGQGNFGMARNNPALESLMYKAGFGVLA